MKKLVRWAPWLATGGLLLSFVGGACAATSVQTIVVGSANPLPAGAKRVGTWASVPWATLAPGSKVLLSPGWYGALTPVTIKGTAAAPITIGAFSTSNPPILTQPVDFQGAQYVELSYLTMRNSPYSAVTIRRSSKNIYVSDCSIEYANMGINITDGAGGGHKIRRNRIQSTVHAGINVDGINASSGARSYITGNVVMDSGGHGMEVRGSYYTIESNTVAGSGRLGGGTSGIHVYAQSKYDGFGDYNVIRYNFSYENRDLYYSDGNGIQMDQWADHNTIAYNVMWHNDGAGIILFDASDNLVYGNTAVANALDPRKTHGDKAEIVVNSSGEWASNAYNDNWRNKVYDNVLVGTNPNAPVMHIDHASMSNSQQIGPNMIYHRRGGYVMRWGHSFLSTAAQVDSYTGKANNLVENPRFVNEGNALADGFRLAKMPSKLGLTLSATDMVGVSPAAGMAYHGAYYTAP